MEHNSDKISEMGNLKTPEECPSNSNEDHSDATEQDIAGE